MYISAYRQTQQTLCNCVPASARFWIQYLRSSGIPSQQTLQNYMEYPRDKSNWASKACPVNSSNPYYSEPHDARGWAWAMYNWSPAGQYFDDYRFSTRSAANWQVVLGIRATSAPVGALVAKGVHAILVVGYETDYDPFVEHNPQYPTGNSLHGFWIWDPWRGRSEGFGPGWPNAGYVENRYVTREFWRDNIFLPYVPEPGVEGSFYKDDFVLVLRKATASDPAGDNPGMTYGTYRYNQVNGLSLTAESAPDAAASPDDAAALVEPADTEPSSTIGEAVAVGLAEHNLGNSAAIGDLRRYDIGAVAHVDALEPTAADYHLVELKVGQAIRAVALVSERDGGFVFSALAQANGTQRVPNADDINRALAHHGLSGSGRLVWAPSATAPSAFAPFVAVTENGSERVTYIHSDGRSDQVVPLGPADR